MNIIKKIIKKVIDTLFRSKKGVELNFWKIMIGEYIDWYNGKTKTLFGENNVDEEKKEKRYPIKENAILTWQKTHQEKKYTEDLMLQPNCLKGKKVLDIGSGPIPSATIFGCEELFCLDPLLADYIKIGYPIHLYEKTKFICSSAENIPVPNNFFDVIMSVNAIDHVDNFEKTALEIKRVLKKEGMLRMHVHYHKSTKAEPVEITDERMTKSFSWCKNFKKLKESVYKYGYNNVKAGEKFTLWSN